MAELHTKTFRFGVIVSLSLCTGWWAAEYHVPWVTSFATPGSYDAIYWWLNNVSLLGLLTLTIPWLIFVARDLRGARKGKTIRPILAHIPCAVFILSAPWMYHPFVWLLSVFGAS